MLAIRSRNGLLRVLAGIIITLCEANSLCYNDIPNALPGNACMVTL